MGGNVVSEKEERDWEKEGNLHKNGVCGLVCSYSSGKIMQLNASKDWGEGGGRDILVSYLPVVGQLTGFLHCCCLFFSEIFHFVFSFWEISIPGCKNWAFNL